MNTINFIKLYESSFKENWNLKALSDLNQNTLYTYGELAIEIARLHILFDKFGIKEGDKIALIGPNHSSWAIVFMATITYGAVIVPILRDFHSVSMENIILHSDAKISFIDRVVWKNINIDRVTHPVFELPSLSIIQDEYNELDSLQTILDEKFLSKYPKGFQIDDVKYSHISNDSTICLNYISGSADFLRGVMLTGNNYVANIISIKKFNFLYKGESNLAFLPMAHAFSCTFDLLYGLTIGVHIHILNKIRNSKMFFEAFQHVKPFLISTVPLILEKIVLSEKEQIINKPLFKVMLKIPLLNRAVYRKTRKNLIAQFGGRHREMLVGGASLNEDVEDFLRKIKFPFSVGYGMTECAPVISIDTHKNFIPRSCGTVVKDTMKARINSEDPYTIPGEIQVIGTHVMKGYYKSPEATAAAFTSDGWLKTGDLGVIDKKNRLYIKGLLKTMILGSNGQNIYPKEIETQLNKMDYVLESLVVKRNHGLVALVFPDYNKIKENELSLSDLHKIMNDNRKELNKMIALYERIGSIEILKNEFEKSEDKKIKRAIYV